VKVFKTQLEIAKRKDFPVVIHCRETEQETLELLSKHLEPEHKIHLHCFTGKWSFAKQFLDKFVNLCIGITPLITQSRSSRDLAELFENLPIDRVLLETDAPYFMPNLNRVFLITILTYLIKFFVIYLFSLFAVSKREAISSCIYFLYSRMLSNM
jgi:Tat protein secretion system quality control protein TatD with DNase activity